MIGLPSLYDLLVFLPVILISLTFHEYAHGWAAHQLGDDTAKHMGRLTLNPIPHIDLLGLILMVFCHFGWAKPVPVNPENLRGDPARGLLLVSLAGPGSNVALALAAAFVFNMGAWGLLSLNGTIYEILYILIQINIVLAFFNLLPVPPLDGSKIFAGLFPNYARFIYSVETYGALLLMALAFSGILGKILWPVVGFITRLLLPI